MEVKTGLEGLTVPKIIEDAYGESLFKEFNGWWFKKGLELFQGEIVSKEIAEFIIGMEINFVPHEGGWPIASCFEFEDNGYEYSIYAYGWAFIDKPKISMVGHKERKGLK